MGALTWIMLISGGVFIVLVIVAAILAVAKPGLFEKVFREPRRAHCKNATPREIDTSDLESRTGTTLRGMAAAMYENFSNKARGNMLRMADLRIAVYRGVAEHFRCRGKLPVTRSDPTACDLREDDNDVSQVTDVLEGAGRYGEVWKLVKSAQIRGWQGKRTVKELLDEGAIVKPPFRVRGCVAARIRGGSEGSEHRRFYAALAEYEMFGTISVVTVKLLMDKAFAAMFLRQGDYYDWNDDTGVQWRRNGENSGDPELTVMLTIRHTGGERRGSVDAARIGMSLADGYMKSKMDQ